MDKELLLEIVSALTGATVSEHTKCRNANAAKLTVQNFMSSTLLSTFRSASPNALPGLRVQLKTLRVADAEPEEMSLELEDFHDPQYDYDFRNLPDSESEVWRGGELYKRPKGWYRFALKVLGKYSDGSAWLGTSGWRKDSAPGEWPVSFHGTGIVGAEGIVEDHYKPGSGQVYGRGIYSSPVLSEAEQYTKPFKSKNGKTYRIILQNRINPCERKICAREEYWLIPIPEGTSSREEERIVMEAIRPYGILVKEV